MFRRRRFWVGKATGSDKKKDGPNVERNDQSCVFQMMFAAWVAPACFIFRNVSASLRIFFWPVYASPIPACFIVRSGMLYFPRYVLLRFVCFSSLFTHVIFLHVYGRSGMLSFPTCFRLGLVCSSGLFTHVLFRHVLWLFRHVVFSDEPVLVAGANFCKSVRAKNELTTHLCPNKVGDKARTSIPERFVQSVREIQKTLLCHIEDELKVAIPDVHPVIQWAAMHAAWLYNRYQVHATMRVTPFQSLRGRPYHGKLASFGQAVFGLDPKATKFKPAWRKGCWLGKDTSGMDLICTDGQTIIRTKAVRKINNQWDAELIIGMTDGPMDFFGHPHIVR